MFVPPFYATFYHHIFPFFFFFFFLILYLLCPSHESRSFYYDQAHIGEGRMVFWVVFLLARDDDARN